MTILDAALSDPLTGAVGGSLATVLITTIGLVVRSIVRARKHAANNAAMVERTDREADAAEHVAEVTAQGAVTVEALRQVPRLINDVRTLMSEKDECKETLVKERGERQAERAEDAAKCQAETARQVEAATAPLREQLARMAEVTAATRASVHGEDTGVTDLRALAAEARRSPTPPEPMAAQPESRREIPPPKRGKGE